MGRLRRSVGSVLPTARSDGIVRYPVVPDDVRWDVDVPHSVVAEGKTTIEVAAGTTFYKNRGFMMSVFARRPSRGAAMRGVSRRASGSGTAHYQSGRPTPRLLRAADGR